MLAHDLLERLKTTSGSVKAKWGVPFDFPSEYTVYEYVGEIVGKQSNGESTKPATSANPLVLAFEDDYEGGFPENSYWFENPTSADDIKAFIFGEET